MGHQDCFWDARDGECSEVKKMPFKNKPVLMAICGNFKTVDQCASQAMCFWDNTVCINVIQATNVCSVLEQPQTCSTNPICHWQNNKCELANIPAPSAGGLRLQKTLELPKATDTSSKTADYLIMFACGFTGALIGLLFALVTQIVCQKSKQASTSNPFHLRNGCFHRVVLSGCFRFILQMEPNGVQSSELFQFFSSRFLEL